MMCIRVLLTFFRWITLRPFAESSQKGAALLLFAIMLPVLLGAMGVVLDGARSLYLKTRFDHALREAALAAASASGDKRSSEARKFFDINFPASKLKARVISFNIQKNDTVTRVTASVECNTYLPNLFLDSSGSKTPQSFLIQGWYEATSPQIEIVFVLSNALRNQPTLQREELLNALKTSTNSLGAVTSYIGLVPFSNGVAVDNTDLCRTLTSQDLIPCSGIFAPLAEYKFQDSRSESMAQETSTWTVGDLSWADPKPSWIQFPRYRSYYGHTQGSQYANYWNIYGTPYQFAQAWYNYTSLNRGPSITWQSWVLKKFWPYQDAFSSSAMLMARGVWPYEMPSYEDIDASSSNWIPFYVYGAYPRPMASLRSDSDDINLRLTSIFEPTATDKQEVNNLPNLGMVWALRMLSPAWRGRWSDNANVAEASTLPNPYLGKTQKIVVLVSPGATSLSKDIVSTQPVIQPQNFVPQQFKNVMNERFQFELFKKWHETYQSLNISLDWNISVNKFIAGSSCGNSNRWTCETKLQNDYSTAWSQMRALFSDSLLDQIAFTRCVRYLWASYLDNPTIQPQYSGNSNWNNILWDANTLISGAWAEPYWAAGSELKFFLTRENAPYCFTNILFGSQIMINMMDFYLKIRYHANNNSAYSVYASPRMTQSTVWVKVGEYYAWLNWPQAKALINPPRVQVTKQTFSSISPTNRYLVETFEPVQSSVLDVNFHYVQDRISNTLMCLGGTVGAYRDNDQEGAIYAFRSSDGADLGEAQRLTYQSWPNAATVSWFNDQSQQYYQRLERGVQIMNAHEIFSYKVIQSEREYIQQTNALSDTLADLEKALWAKIPAYGVLGTSLNLNGVSLGDKFNINGVASSSLSDAVPRLNQAFLDVCSALKDNQKKVTIYTVNVGQFSDEATMQACASSPEKHFYVDPTYTGNFSNVFSVITKDILQSGRVYLSGKSW